MKTVIIGAGSDLGVHIDGANLGPVQLLNDLKSFYKGDEQLFVQNEDIIKSRNLSDRRKNEYEIDKFNTNLYNYILTKDKGEFFPITIGGDKSVSIASSLASVKKNENIGMIWFSSDADYNTFESTVTGDISGLSLAAINGYKNHELRYYHQDSVIQTAKTVVIGARTIDDWEKDNVKYSGLTVFTMDDIRKKGLEKVLEEAFKIASEKTHGIHISFSLDIIDPDIAPGVSIPRFNGLTEDEAMKINETIIKNIDNIVSYDLLEFNPLRDQNRKTEQIAINLLAQIIATIPKKGKTFTRKY